MRTVFILMRRFRRNRFGATTFRVADIFTSIPRVGSRTRQPWADDAIPLGLREGRGGSQRSEVRGRRPEGGETRNEFPRSGGLEDGNDLGFSGCDESEKHGTYASEVTARQGEFQIGDLKFQKGTVNA